MRESERSALMAGRRRRTTAAPGAALYMRSVRTSGRTCAHMHIIFVAVSPARAVLSALQKIEGCAGALGAWVDYSKYSYSISRGEVENGT